MLMLINGAPGSGKSTMAAMIAARRRLALSFDIDSLKHGLGCWEEDMHASGLQARRVAVAAARQHLTDGFDVVLGQYLARTAFIEELEQLARECRSHFIETVLIVDADALARRLAARVEAPDRAEHDINNRLVGPADVGVLVESIETVLTQRPSARRIDANGTMTQTFNLLRAHFPCTSSVPDSSANSCLEQCVGGSRHENP